MTTFYMISYGIVLFVFFVCLAALLLGNLCNRVIELYEDQDDEDGGIYSNTEELPDIPLPPGISLHTSEKEPKYDTIKEYV